MLFGGNIGIYGANGIYDVGEINARAKCHYNCVNFFDFSFRGNISVSYCDHGYYGKVKRIEVNIKYFISINFLSFNPTL